jgi:hypothetical protein
MTNMPAGDQAPSVLTMSAQTIIVMFFLVCGLVVLEMFGKKGAFQDVRQIAEYHAICRRVLVHAAFCAVERLSHSSKRVGARRALLPGVRLRSFSSVPK